MFLSKKIAKLQRFKEAQVQQQKLTQSPSQTESELGQKIYEGGTKANRYRFKLIPPHSKYTNTQPVYSLHGDWPIIIKDNQLTTELSLFNEYKVFQNVAVMEQYGQKIVQIKPDIRKEKCFNTMTEVMDLFPTSHGNDQTPWPKTFKHYYQTYDKVMKRQSRKKMKSDTRKKFYLKVDEQTEAKTQELFEKHPSFLMKFRLKSHHSMLTELLFGEKFVQELGHDIESFVTSIFQEGLPQIMPLDNPNSTFMMRTLIEKYFAVEENGTEIPGLSTTLLMKDGLARPIQYKVTFLMNYEMNTFGMDVVFSITEKGEAYSQSQDNQMNEIFLQTMAKRKEETLHFLSEFYSSDRVGCLQDYIQEPQESESELEDEGQNSEPIIFIKQEKEEKDNEEDC